MPYEKLVQPNPQPKRPLVFPPSKGAAAGRVAPPKAPPPLPPLPKQQVPRTHPVNYRGKPLPELPQRTSLSFPLSVNLTVDQRNALVSRECFLDVKLGDDPKSGKRVDLVHTNVVGSKVILEDFPPRLFGPIPSVYWEEVSVTLTKDQRNGLLSRVYFLDVSLVDAPQPAKWVDFGQTPATKEVSQTPLQFTLEDPNGVCLALWGPLAATEARDRRRVRHELARDHGLD